MANTVRLPSVKTNLDSALWNYKTCYSTQLSPVCRFNKPYFMQSLLLQPTLQQVMHSKYEHTSNSLLALPSEEFLLFYILVLVCWRVPAPTTITSCYSCRPEISPIGSVCSVPTHLMTWTECLTVHSSTKETTRIRFGHEVVTNVVTQEVMLQTQIAQIHCADTRAFFSRSAQNKM